MIPKLTIITRVLTSLRKTINRIGNEFTSISRCTERTLNEIGNSPFSALLSRSDHLFPMLVGPDWAVLYKIIEVICLVHTL